MSLHVAEDNVSVIESSTYRVVSNTLGTKWGNRYVPVTAKVKIHGRNWLREQIRELKKSQQNAAARDAAAASVVGHGLRALTNQRRTTNGGSSMLQRSLSAVAGSSSSSIPTTPTKAQTLAIRDVPSLGRCRQVARDARAVASDVATEVPDADDDDDSVALSSLPSTVYQKPGQLDNAESEFDLSDEECRPLKGRPKTIADWMVTLTPTRVWQGVVASIATK